MADGFCKVCLLCQVFGSDAGEDAYSEGGSGAVSISPRGNAYAAQYEQATSSHVSNRESYKTAQVLFWFHLLMCCSCTRRLPQQSQPVWLNTNTFCKIGSDTFNEAAEANTI